MIKPSTATRQEVEKLNRFFLIIFGMIALGMVFWTLGQERNLLSRKDNPRLVEMEQQIKRGTIFDTQNQPLATSVGQKRGSRLYAPASGAAVGYLSLVYGTTGIEAGYDALLRGQTGAWQTWWQNEVHRPAIGRDVRLTLSGKLQLAADRLMPNKGAILLATLPDLAIRILLNHPNYDANLLDEQFESLREDSSAPLLNRAIQGKYQPGTVLLPFWFASALEEGVIKLEDRRSTAQNGSVTVQGQLLPCVQPLPDDQLTVSWQEALQRSCPQPFTALARSWPTTELDRIMGNWKLNRPVYLPLGVETPSQERSADARLGLLGQGEMTVTPVQLLRAWGALANHGAVKELQLVEAISAESGEWQWEPESPFEQSALSAQSAKITLATLPRFGKLIEHQATAIAGTRYQWYLGLAPSDDPRFALVVVVEDGSTNQAQEIGRTILTDLLDTKLENP